MSAYSWPTDLTVGDPPPGCTCGAYWSILPPEPCPYHAPQFAWVTPPQTSDRITIALADPNPSPPLSDDDVDRIARRVVELLKASEP